MATNTQKKAQAHMAARDTRPAAHAKYVRISSRKVKIVIDLIRGKNVDDALAILKYTPKAASPVVYKLLNSAIANAVNNNGVELVRDVDIAAFQAAVAPIYDNLKATEPDVYAVVEKIRAAAAQ